MTAIVTAEDAEEATKYGRLLQVAVKETESFFKGVKSQIDDIKKKMDELQQQQKELEKSLTPIRQRLGLTGARKEKGAPAPENPDMAALRVAADAARKALEDKAADRLKADPDGAVLLQKRDELKAKMAELHGAAHASKAERKP